MKLSKFKYAIMAAAFFLLLFSSKNIADAANFYHEDSFIMWNHEFSGYLDLERANYNLHTNFRRNGDFKKRSTAGFGWFFRAGGRAEGYIGFMQMDHSSDILAMGAIDDVEFDGRKFKVDRDHATVNLKLKIDMFDFLIFRRLKNYSWGHVNLLYGVKTLQSDLKVTDVNSPVSAGLSKVLPIPHIGLDGQYNFSEKFSAYGLLSGLSLHVKDKRGSFANLDAAAKYEFDSEERIGVNISVMAGYREQYIDYEMERNKYVVRHAGPYLKVTGKF